MITIYTNIHTAHQPAFELYDGQQEPYAESARRVDSIIQTLTTRQLGTVIAPKKFALSHIEAVHSRAYIDFVKHQARSISEHRTVIPSYFITDTYAPLTRGTYVASRAAVDTALTGAKLVTTGQSVVYSLCRPPGHHASHHSMGGYCYFNNAAIAANYLSAFGTVCILDIDYHHGNGTQDIFYNRNDVLYVSLHADPKTNYPYIHGTKDEIGEGVGTGFTINYPLSNNTTDQTYLRTLDQALAEIARFTPDYLVISAGFDTYNLDPIGGMRLTKNVYKVCGQRIKNLNLPTLVIQEGGYNVDDLGFLVGEFLAGLSA